MRDVLEELVRRGEAGETVGLGTVVSTWNSAPPSAGAAMFAGYDGSLSDGCGEGAVYELARQVVADGTPVLERCGVSGDDAFLRALPEALGWRRQESLQEVGRRGGRANWDAFRQLFMTAQKRVEKRHRRQRLDLMYSDKQRRETLQDLGADPFVD